MAAEKTGRKSKIFDQGLLCQIEEEIGRGRNIEEICLLTGLSKRTFHRWMEKGAPPEKASEDWKPSQRKEPYWHFWHMVRRARASYEAEMQDKISIAAEDPKHWKAAAFILERRNPTVWGQTVNVRVRRELEELLGEFLSIIRGQVDDETWEIILGATEAVGGRKEES